VAGEGTLRQRQQQRRSRTICPSRRKSGVEPVRDRSWDRSRKRGPGALACYCNSQRPSASRASSGRGRPEHDAKVLAAAVVPIRARLYHEVRGSPIWGKRNPTLCGSYRGSCMLPIRQSYTREGDISVRKSSDFAERHSRTVDDDSRLRSAEMRELSARLLLWVFVLQRKAATAIGRRTSGRQIATCGIHGRA